MSELASQTNIGLSLLHYHLSRLRKLGLVRLAKTQSRKGKSIKYYRAVAYNFYVPASLASIDPTVELSRRMQHSLERDRLKTLKGIVYSSDDIGPQIRMIPNDHLATSSIDIWHEVRLRNEDATAFIDELQTLVKKFAMPSEVGKANYLLHLALAKM